jgi:DNA-binding CsgD family transcriptional regulator
VRTKLSYPAKLDLTRLNAAEVQALELLADGHTAKSIASLTGRSVVSVNERLRQARRKTGVSSSRELARLLKAQKNGHEQIGLFPSDILPQSSTRFRMGALAVGVLFLAIAATAFVSHQGSDTAHGPSPITDPVLSGVLPTAEWEPRRLAELVRTEVRDPAWASQLETELRKRFSSLVAAGDVRLTRVTCARTVCEVVGEINETDLKRAEVVGRNLQDEKLNILGDGKAKHVAISFGSKGFASYWARA